MIYFIATADRSRIKIGTTTRLTTRLTNLSTKHGKGLEVVAVIDGSYDEERELHRRFAHLRALDAPGREWFVGGLELLEFIERKGRAWNGLDEVIDPNMPVKVDRAVVGKAKMVATHRGVSVAELLSEAARPTIDKAYAAMLRELEGTAK